MASSTSDSVESSFFVERALFFALLRDAVAARDADAIEPLVKRMSAIVDKYQEQAQLLDPHLEAAVVPVMGRVRGELRAWHAAAAAASQSAAAFPQAYANAPLHRLLTLVYALCKTRGYKHVIKYFPHEVADLEPCVQALVCQDSGDHSTWAMRYVLLLWLSILVLIPFDLTTVDSFAGGSGRGGGSKGIISTILDLCKGFLSDPGAVRNAAAVCISRLITRPDVDRAQLRSYLDWATGTLAACNARVPGPGGAGAAVDEADEAGSNAAVEPAASSAANVRNVAASADPASSAPAIAAASLSSRVFLATGVLTSLVEIAKHGHRDALLEVLGDTFLRVSAICASADAADAKAVASAAAAGAAAAGFRGSGLKASPLLRRLTVKLAARTGLTYLPPRVVAWRYSRGARSLLENLSMAGVAAAKKAAAAVADATDAPSPSAGVERQSAKGLLRTGNASLRDTSLSLESAAPRAAQGAAPPRPQAGGGEVAAAAAAAATAETDDDGAEADVPAEMEEIIDMLLQGLRDTDTVVRWSAAKGVGRVTGRLPRDFADDVVAAVLQLLTSQEGDGAWHGGCLALAELARRGLLLPSRLDAVVPLVLQALKYDVRRGAHSVGTHVRDAACYVCWAFARAYAPAVLRPHVLRLAQGMLITSLFDREVNCRRAASAAFQENVGRQGHENFPNGIAILTAADYFTLGNRLNAFLVVAPSVGAFPTYRYALLDHLLNTKLRHWDQDVRELSARALARLAGLDPAWAVDVALPALLPLVVSPDVFTRHGATLAVAELVLGLAQVAPSVRVPGAVLDQVRNVVVVAEKARVYTGRGGEMVRAAMCRLIECQCLAGHTLSRRAALRLLQTIDDCLKHPNDLIQASAVAALRALAVHALGEPEPAVLDRLTRAYVTRVADENPAVRRGSALALGVLPRALLTLAAGPELLDAVVVALYRATQPEKAAYKRDAETRRNAAIALADLVATVGFGRVDATTPRRLLASNSDAGADAGKVAGAKVGVGAGLSKPQLATVWSALLLATRDYATDNRGDVGSWVRKAAVESLERIAVLLQAAAWRHRAAQRALATLRAYIVVPVDAEAASPDSSAAVSAAEELRVLLRNDACAAAGGGAQRLELLQHTSGYGNITGYSAGTRLLASLSSSTAAADGGGLAARVDATVSADGSLRRGQAVQTAYGVGVVAALAGGGALCEVAFPARSMGAACFPYGAGLIAARRLQGATAAQSAAACGFGAGAGSADSAAAREADVLALLCFGLPGGTAAHVAAPAEDVSAFLGEADLLLMLGCLLRQASEKLDLLRAVSGDALCRLLRLPRPLAPLAGVPHRERLEAVFPEPNWRGDRPSADFEFGPEDAGAGDDDAEPATFAEEDASPAALAALPPAAAASASASSSSSAMPVPESAQVVQWAIPHQCFPRVTQLLGLPEYTPALVEGLVTAVGGLSESVVKHSAAALTGWAAEARRGARVPEVAAVADALLLLVKPRLKLPWEMSEPVSASASASAPSSLVSAAAASTGYGFDPSLQRWFKEILGGGGRGGGAGGDAGAGGGAASGRGDIDATHKVDVRVIVPTLRTTEVLLAAGGLDALRPPASMWPADMLLMAKRRVERSREDVGRVLAAAAVYLGLLRFGGEVARQALLLLLDLLGHPFPRVRKSAAERLYVRLLSLDASELGGDAALPAAAEAAAAAPSAAVAAATAESLEAAQAVLSETAWDAPLEAVLGPRDGLYALLGLALPEARMGLSADDRALARGEALGGGTAGATAGGDNFDSYGALFRESGY